MTKEEIKTAEDYLKSLHYFDSPHFPFATVALLMEQYANQKQEVKQVSDEEIDEMVKGHMIQPVSLDDIAFQNGFRSGLVTMRDKLNK